MNNEFIANPWEVEIRDNALNYESTVLLEDQLATTENLKDGVYTAEVDLGEGYDFVFVGFRSLGNREGVRVDNVSLTGDSNATLDCILGDTNADGLINLLDVQPFVEAISDGTFLPAADINQDGAVNLLDVGPFVELLSN